MYSLRPCVATNVYRNTLANNANGLVVAPAIGNTKFGLTGLYIPSDTAGVWQSHTALNLLK